MAIDAGQVVDAACANSDLIKQALMYAGATMPVASVAVWITAWWGKLPPGLQTLLQVLAGNVLHAILGEPTAPVMKPPPAPGS